MNFQSNAPKSASGQWKFRWWHILLFTGLLLAATLVFFPQKNLIKLLTSNNAHPSQLAAIYLRNLAVLYPQDAELHLALAEQELGLGNLANADKAIIGFLTMTPNNPLQWRVIALHYQVTRTETYAFAEHSAGRLQGEAEMKRLLPILAKSPDLSVDQAKNLAQDALSIDKADIAVALYKRIIAAAPNQSPEFFANAGKVALFASDYQSSGEFYLLAMQGSDNLPKKRDYYKAALNSLLAGGKPAMVMEFAEKNIDGLAQDQLTLLFLAKMAMNANEGDFAQKYIKQALEFKYLPVDPKDQSNPGKI